MVSGVLPVPRYNGEVQLKDPADKRVLATWTFERGLPAKVQRPVAEREDRRDRRSRSCTSSTRDCAWEGRDT